jgi:eukaryotic-like serine/threonine-protein kinase
MTEPKLRLDQFFDQAMDLRQSTNATEKPELDPSLWPYEDDKLINEGGMKRVLRCRDRRSGRFVARAEVLRPEDNEKFLREARLTAQLQHPNIMPIYEIGARDGRDIYFTMKLVIGGDLEDLLGRLRSGDEDAFYSYPLEARLEIFSRICEAMAYAHEHGVIHLDLKPANIQISAHGEVLVCDWGIARVLDEVCVDPGLLDISLAAHELNSMTCDGYIKGTPGYMSPEQAGGHKTRKSQSSDIYSLGAILYCLICLQKPIPGKTVEEILAFTRRGVVQPLERFRRRMNIPSGLESICMKALEHRPEDRYATVNDLQQDLNKYRYGFATSAENASFVKQFQLLIKRNRKIVSVVAAALCFVVVLTAIFVVNLSIKEAQAKNASEKATGAQRIAEEAQFRAEMAQKLAEERQRALQAEINRSKGRAAVPASER